MKDYYEEVAAKQAVMLKKHMSWEPQESTRPTSDYDYIRMHD